MKSDRQSQFQEIFHNKPNCFWVSVNLYVYLKQLNRNNMPLNFKQKSGHEIKNRNPVIYNKIEGSLKHKGVMP